MQVIPLRGLASKGFSSQTGPDSFRNKDIESGRGERAADLRLMQELTSVLLPHALQHRGCTSSRPETPANLQALRAAPSVSPTHPVDHQCHLLAWALPGLVHILPSSLDQLLLLQHCCLTNSRGPLWPTVTGSSFSWLWTSTDLSWTDP